MRTPLSGLLFLFLSVCPLVFIQYFFGYLHAARFYEYLWRALRSLESNAKCAFWVKLYHKPRAACKAEWKVKNGRKYNNNNVQFYIYVYIFGCAKTQNQSKVKPAWNPRYGHNANLWSEFNYVLIGTQLLRSRFLWLHPTPIPPATSPANVCGCPYLVAGTCWASCWAGRQLMLRSLTLKAKMLWFTHTHTGTHREIHTDTTVAQLHLWCVARILCAPSGSSGRGTGVIKPVNK